MAETIEAAAIRYQGKVWWLMRPCRHCHVIQMIAQALDIDHVGQDEQGFRTSTGRFVDRVEGAAIAIAAGQIEALMWPPDLYSEDLW